MLRKWIAFAMLVATSVATPARADDFVSDLAQCAKAPIVAASFATDDLKTAATFIAQHGECVPMVTSGDPLLYGLSPTISVLQQQGVLGQGTQACIDDTLGKASREMSGVLSKFADAAPMSTLVPSKSRQLLLAIANGQSNEPLYSVP